jgi:hypothetical protein
MPQNQEDQKRGRGHHSKHNEAKYKIIEFILYERRFVSGPAIRKYLEDKGGIPHHTGINRHLHQ